LYVKRVLLAAPFVVNVITDVLELSRHVYALFLARLTTRAYCFVAKEGDVFKVTTKPNNHLPNLMLEAIISL
jgi:hypothetical protein